jgi:mannitol/fructose-specific phosphotransferase system IIA component (Ntr-type)
MAKKLDPKELVTFKELLISNSIEVEALAQLLVEKGVLTFEEIFEKLAEVKKNYKTPL